MGRVRLRRCRSRGEHEDFAFVDRAGQRRRIAAVEYKSESRGAPAVFAGRKTADLDIESHRSDANLDVRFRFGKRGARREAASGNGKVNWRRRRDLVTRWQKHRVRIGSLSGLQG